jgi:protein-S-isoprenylcysteine O-methyltransferase Ste14
MKHKIQSGSNHTNARKVLLIIPSSVLFMVIVPLASAFAGRRFDKLAGMPPLEPGMTCMIVAAVLLLVGGWFVLKSIQVLLVRGGGIPLGDVIPSDQSTDLLTGGIYRLTRNPMLFGYLCCLVAEGIFLESLTTAFLIPTLLIVPWSLWLKLKEEPGLEARFGESYREYRRQTPFLIPGLRRKDES